MGWSAPIKAMKNEKWRMKNAKRESGNRGGGVGQAVFRPWLLLFFCVIPYGRRRASQASGPNGCLDILHFSFSIFHFSLLLQELPGDLHPPLAGVLKRELQRWWLPTR